MTAALTSGKGVLVQTCARASPATTAPSNAIKPTTERAVFIFRSSPSLSPRGQARAPLDFLGADALCCSYAGSLMNASASAADNYNAKHKEVKTNLTIELYTASARADAVTSARSLSPGGGDRRAAPHRGAAPPRAPREV